MADTFALVRPIPDSVANGLSIEKSETPVSVQTAREQHHKYTQILQAILGANNVIELPAAHNLPDSTFVEDPVIIANQTVLFNHVGAPSRRPELQAFKDFFSSSPLFKHFTLIDMHSVNPLATLDGGDVLYIDEAKLFVIGISSRTNEQGVKVLQDAHPNCKVHAVKLMRGLHLKSFCSLLGITPSKTLNNIHLVIANDAVGQDLAKQMKEFLDLTRFVVHMVPDIPSSNLVSIQKHDANKLQNHVILKAGYPMGDEIFEEIAKQYPDNFVYHKIEYGEVEKIDGALTCCSVIFNK